MPGIEEIRQLTPDPIHFSAYQLAEHLEQHNPANLLIGAASVTDQALRGRIPTRKNVTLQWTNLARVGDTSVPDIFRPCGVDDAQDYVNDYEAELARLAALGVRVPPHVSYLVPNDPHQQAPVLYSVVRQRKSATPWSVVYGQDTYASDERSIFYDDVLALGRTRLRYYTERSLRPWRINNIVELGAFTTGRELLFLRPHLAEPHVATEEGLSHLRNELEALPSSDTHTKLVEDVARHLLKLGL